VQNFENVHLTLIGDGNLHKDLKEFTCKFPSKFHILPRSTRIEIKKTAMQWDFAIFVSTYEGNPKAIIEMMAMSLPILATPVKGINEIVIHGQNGFLSSGTNVDSITDLIKMALNSRVADRITLGDNGKKQIISQNSLDAVVKKQLLDYKSLF
jgi:glycosyltransferase involved in cell wall biosynthesis